MQVTIVGSGAIGGSVGAFLARAGHEVTMVDVDPAHVKAMQERGLTLKGKADFTVPVRACLPQELTGPLGIVFLSVKAMHTESAMAAIAPLLAEDGYVLSLQNGLEEPKIAAKVGKERTIGAFINFTADYHGPGEIMYGGPAAFVIGELDGSTTPRLQELASVLAVIQPIKLSDNVQGYLWGKLSLASPLFATACVDADVADMLANPRYQELFANCSAEVIAVAEAAGVRCVGFDGYDPSVMRLVTPRNLDGIRTSWLKYKEYWDASLKKRTGIWRDLAVRKRKTEVEWQMTPVIDAGAALGHKLPLNRAVRQMIREIENGTRQMDWSNLEELLKVTVR
jgi:2-dehydropantoate 2-reductase